MQPDVKFSIEFDAIRDFYRNPAHAQFEQERRVGGSFRVEMTEVSQDWREFTYPASPKLSISGVFDATGSAELDFGDGWRANRLRGGIFGPLPSNQVCRFKVTHPHRVLVASIPVHIAHNQFNSVGISGDPLRSLYARYSPDPTGFAHLRSMWYAMKAGGPANNLLIDSHVIALLGLMMIEASDARKFVNAPTLDSSRLARVIDYIEIHFGAPLQISDLAKIAVMSPVHFGRSFKKAVGYSPYQYLIKRRVEHSSRLLCAGRLSVTEIAYLCGFASPAHFSTLFCKCVGLSPIAFREKFVS